MKIARSSSPATVLIRTPYRCSKNAFCIPITSQCPNRIEHLFERHENAEVRQNQGRESEVAGTVLAMKRTLAALAALPLLVSFAACGGDGDGDEAGGEKRATKAEPITVAGALYLSSSQMAAGVSASVGNCMGTGGYDDIKEGAQVTVLDDGGKTVGVGEIGDSEVWTQGQCRLKFSVEDVPSGGGIYSIKISQRDAFSFKEDEAGDLSLNLGS